MQTGKARFECSKKSKVELLYDTYEEDRICETTGKLLSFAIELLSDNNIARSSVTNFIKTALERRRNKYRNIMLTRPTNIGKTFLLHPLNKIYKSFANPASTSFVWTGAEKAGIIFHNDFRWSPQIIT